MYMCCTCFVQAQREAEVLKLKQQLADANDAASKAQAKLAEAKRQLGRKEVGSTTFSKVCRSHACAHTRDYAWSCLAARKSTHACIHRRMRDRTQM